jgi:hypothetical protein
MLIEFSDAFYAQRVSVVTIQKATLLPLTAFNTSLLYICSQSSGDSDLIGIEDNPEFRPYGRNGVANSSFTPELGSGMQAYVNVMVTSGLDPESSINPLSAATVQNALTTSTTRRQSVNPLAGTFNGENSDYEDLSRRLSDNSIHNSNFTYVRRSDSEQATEL